MSMPVHNPKSHIVKKRPSPRKVKRCHYLPPIDVVLKYLTYDPDLGEFGRPPGSRVHGNINKEVGNVVRGNLLITIEGVNYRADRLVWLLTRGEDPVGLDVTNEWEDPRVCLPHGIHGTPIVPFKYASAKGTIDAKPMPSRQWLISRYDYDLATGDLFIKGPFGRWKKAGARTMRGYVIVSVCGGTLMAHRMVWQMFKGNLGHQDAVDHINGDRSDNRIENLRLADAAQNAHNSLRAKPRSGVRNVVWCASSEKWQAGVTSRGVPHYLGLHGTLEGAAEVVRAFKEKHHGDFANYGFKEPTPKNPSRRKAGRPPKKFP